MSLMKELLMKERFEVLTVQDVHTLPRAKQREFMLELMHALTPQEVVELARQGYTPRELDYFRDLVMRIPYA